ncbi:ATP-dependent 6-phosphofructokinase [Candidatus Hepatoplasma crinochetorum]|uniref:ATP-dependent 6-phosphofructokinase n=1 Tax=Candidatus Hepatoplasma crinochetorum TaxID=295596 RepID=UPI00308A5EF7|nr:MAG: ATP-dependent 6-phosphofructokinase [Candidatus Hepatoplasma crinochetorum]
MIKKIAILTSGGDCPGMNVALKAVVNSAINNNIEPYVVFEGYKGLYENNFEKISKEEVKFIDRKGGTVIYSARFPQFADLDIRKKAVENLKAEGIEALVCIGGDGTYKGAARLTEMGIKTIGLPGTIDNDISSTDFTIGFNTALETITNAIDNLRDTSESHNRINVVETMGHGCGDLAINAAIITGAEVLSVPERKLTTKQMIDKLLASDSKRSKIVLVSELMYNDLNKIAEEIERATKQETKVTVLGHIQRGGRANAIERLLTIRMANYAVKMLIKGKTGVAVNIVNNKFQTKPILDIVKMERPSKQKILSEYDEIV